MLLVDFNVSSIKFHKNLSRGSRPDTCGPTDRYDAHDVFHDCTQAHLKLGQQNNQLFKHTQCKTSFFKITIITQCYN